MSKIACVFPGQGSQSTGMLAALAEQFPVVLETFAEASSIVGCDLWQLAQTGSKQDLDSTIITQPLMLAADIAVWRVWQMQTGPAPEVLAGHSLGEYAALVAAESLSYTDALKVVKVRAQAMAAAVPEGSGAMLVVVGLDDDTVADLCAKASDSETITPANFNAPGQVVAAGSALAAERLLKLAKDNGARMAKLLPVSVPSHCALMQPAVAALQDALQSINIRTPKIPVLSNVTASVYNSEAEIYSGLVEQITAPVRWVEICQKIAATGVDWMLECGPGKVLCGLAKRSIKEVACTVLGEPEQLAMVIKELSGDD